MTKIELMHSYSLPLHGAERIWLHDFAPALKDALTQSQYELVHEAFDAFADNASHYSHGSTLHIVAELSDNNIELTFQDNGVGIYKRMAMAVPEQQTAFDILDAYIRKHPDCSIHQLAQRFDYVQIEANGLCFPRLPGAVDDDQEFNQGTAIVLALTLNH